MTLFRYDERELVKRLSRLDRQSKTAFAASCAQRLLPMFDRYAKAAGTPELSSRLAMIVDSAWEVASGASTRSDLSALQAEAEAMVPTDKDGWTREMGYGQNAAAATAYAVRAWLTDDPQEAAWAARQVYELADYAVLQRDPNLDLNAPDAEARVLLSDLVQDALGTLDQALAAAEGEPSSWQKLRADSEAGGQALAADVP